MIKEEYKRLMGMLEQSVDSKDFNLEEILKEAVIFFETLRKEFPSSPKEEREEMVQMMTHLHAKLQAVSKKTAEEAGMSEDELAAFSENPSNFTPEQWQVVQEARRKLYNSARKFSSTMGKERKEQAAEGKEVKPKRTIKPRTRRARRQDWTKT